MAAERAQIPGWPSPPPIPGVISEAEAGRYWALSGSRVRQANGRTWLTGDGRIWRPVAFVEPVRHLGLRYPAPTAWAIQAVPGQPSDANGVMPWVLFRDVASFTPDRVAKTRRRDIRRALREFEYSALAEPSLLLSQGWDVAAVAAADSGTWLPPDRGAYDAYVTGLFAGTPPLIVAGSQDGRLAGYLMSFAVGDIAYLQDLYIAPWARPRNMGAGLYWLCLQAWRSVPGISHASAGRVLGDSVDWYKQTLGADIVDLPLVTQVRRPVAAALKRFRPDSPLLGQIQG